MEYVKDDEREYVNTEELDLEGDWIVVENTRGYGRKEVTVGHCSMTWAQFDKLKAAMDEAEKRWRVIDE